LFNVHLFGSWTFQLLTGASAIILGAFMCVSALVLNSLILLKVSMRKSRT
jgi:hypothetical protein